MKKLQLAFCITLLFFGLITSSSAQEADNDISASDIFVDKDSKYTKSLLRIIEDLKNTIQVRLNDIEKKHAQLVLLKPEFKNKHTIITEDIPFTIDEGYESNLLKFISFEYDGTKIRQVKLESRKKRILFEFAFENKTMLINPNDVMSTEVILTRFDTEQKTVIKTISLDNQIRALRLMESSLRNAFYRMDVMIVLLKDKKDRANEYQIDI
ncbi:hypothetical protein [Leptospira sp. GIMC2001]|uniref:hypothetical protein n=1 Tax=Leptospira sp. GIMC2001 TaxID=1513297 RepID=UPI002349B2C5|nr:hypothetical protein [Leptospira sp. GIMC2001]WCL51119.1 hypothetical protein O4O04_09990 [Leptospira sp. GIMC2001]